MARKKQPQARKSRQYVPPMLYDGTPDAIKAIRERKGLSQEQAAQRAGVKAYQWSDYETRSKRLGLPELPIILAGLGVTRTELQSEKYKADERYYKTVPDEVREDAPRYGTPEAVSALQSIWQLDGDQLLPEDRKEFHDLREGVGIGLTNEMHRVDWLKEYYARRVKLARDREDHET